MFHSSLIHILFYHLNISAGERQVHVNSPRLFPSVPTKSMSFANNTVKVGNFVEALNIKRVVFPPMLRASSIDSGSFLNAPSSSETSRHIFYQIPSLPKVLIIKRSPSERLREKDGKPTGHCGDHSHDEHWCRQPENLVGKKLQLL